LRYNLQQERTIFSGGGASTGGGTFTTALQLNVGIRDGMVLRVNQLSLYLDGLLGRCDNGKSQEKEYKGPQGPGIF
jgi:hypothetical protein